MAEGPRSRKYSRSQALAALPQDEQDAWRSFWADAGRVLQQLRAAVVETTVQGTLTHKRPSDVHQLKMVAGQRYVIEMHSTDLDSYLKLHDPAGKLLAENDDALPPNLDARLIYVPQADGIYRILATLHQERGAARIRSPFGPPVRVSEQATSGMNCSVSCA